MQTTCRYTMNELEEIYKKQTKLYYICSVLRISSYDENGIVFLSEGQKNWPKKHQGIDLIFALFIFWTANFCPQFVPRSIS